MSGPAGSAVQLWNGVDNALSGVEDVVDSVCRTLAWPLIQLVDMVDGEPEALRARAGDWDALAAQVRELALSHRGVREAEQPGWRSPGWRSATPKRPEREPTTYCSPASPR